MAQDTDLRCANARALCPSQAPVGVPSSNFAARSVATVNRVSQSHSTAAYTAETDEFSLSRVCTAVYVRQIGFLEVSFFLSTGPSYVSRANISG